MAGVSDEQRAICTNGEYLWQMLEACLYPPVNRKTWLEEQNPVLNTKLLATVKGQPFPSLAVFFSVFPTILKISIQKYQTFSLLFCTSRSSACYIPTSNASDLISAVAIISKDRSVPAKKRTACLQPCLSQVKGFFIIIF